ncbi:MAG: hypothetical protein ABID38_01835 [Candidatus Diapherotrites archaeon]
MKTPNSIFWLATARYLPEKREMVVEFSNSLSKVVERFKFFPSFYVEGINSERLNAAIKKEELKRFQFLEEGEGWKVVGATFTDLLNLSDELHKKGLTPLLLGPERQFLLEREWSYFDCFSIESGNIIKLSNFLVPNTSLNFLPTNLGMALEEINGVGGEAAGGFAKRIAVSNLLSIPLEHAIPDAVKNAEAFIENIYFRKNISLQKGTPNNIATKPKVKGRFEDVAELNFSKLWGMLLTFPFFNLGAETINCKCCKPENLSAANLLPNSLVRVKFNSNGFYFQSCSNSWAEEFHGKNPGKSERISHMKEWSLDSIPAGPFFEGDIEPIPLADYRELSENGTLSLLSGNYALKWFCRKRESSLSIAVNGLNRQLIAVKTETEKKQRELIRQSNLLAYQEITSESRQIYLGSYALLIGEIIEKIPELAASNSSLFSREMIEGIECIKSSVLGKFRGFAAINGVKCIPLDSSRAYIDSDSALKFLENFSEKFSIPRPEILSHRKYVSLNI